MGTSVYEIDTAFNFGTDKNSLALNMEEAGSTKILVLIY